MPSAVAPSTCCPSRVASSCRRARGVVTRFPRLAPNTEVATRAVTATADPMSAVTTGTLDRPRPRSSALRTPTRTLGGAPARPTNATVEFARLTDSSREFGPKRFWAARHDGIAASTRTAATMSTAPRPIGSPPKTNPWFGSAARASPSGVRGDRANARATAPRAPTNPMDPERAIPSPNSCRGLTPKAARVG